MYNVLCCGLAANHQTKQPPKNCWWLLKEKMPLLGVCMLQCRRRNGFRVETVAVAILIQCSMHSQIACFLKIHLNRLDSEYECFSFGITARYKIVLTPSTWGGGLTHKYDDNEHQHRRQRAPTDSYLHSIDIAT